MPFHEVPEYVPFIKATRGSLSFIPETEYVVPTSGKDSTPSASEGPRFLSRKNYDKYKFFSFELWWLVNGPETYHKTNSDRWKF